FIGVPTSSALLLLLTLTLAFLYGLCTVFFLSALYARSRALLWGAVLLLCTIWGSVVAFTGINPALLFPPLLLYYAFSWTNLVLSVFVLSVLFALAVILFSPDQVGTTKEFRDAFAPLEQRFGFLADPPLAAKDVIDLYRSGSAVGQTLFSFLIPLAVIWFFLSLLGPYLPPHGLLFLFAIITGVIASTMYTWVTMFDSFGPYACLPVAVSRLISGKLMTFSLLQVVPVLFIAAVSLMSGETGNLVPAVVLCLAVSYYAVGIMVWLTGLSPNVLVYDVKVMAVYLVLVGIVLTLFSALAFANPLYALLSAVLFLPAWFFIRKGKVRWDAVDPSGF
ncbi:MAG: hypothetical protein GYA23_00320, partial [Methanomicrobiales archaeon]|nr:hypothetical protein [Methanomicrobiales archaeon]